MENFTIHIFGYGETQINSKDFSIKVETSGLTNVNPLIQAVFDLKPEENTLEINQFHVIHIFGHENINWASSVKDVNGFSVKNELSLTSLIDSLIAELKAIFDLQVAEVD
jgi:type IV secretory pathway TrbL component